MFWLLLVAAATLAAMYNRWSRRGIHKAYAEMPLGVPRWPIIGHGYLFRGTDEDRMTAVQKIGRVAICQRGLSSLWLGHRLYAILADPEAIEVVAKTVLAKDDNTMKYLRMIIGNSLIFAPVNIWRLRRKIMAPTFNIKNLREFVKIFERQSSVMVDQLSACAGRGDFSIWPYITAYTFDAVCESALGVNINSQRQLQADHPFIVAFDKITQIASKRMLSPWLYWDWIFSFTRDFEAWVEQLKFIHGFFDKLIRDKREQLANQSTDDKCTSERGLKTFLEMLIETSGEAKGYTDLELREETMTIVMAGTDTSAVGSSFTALLLARYPEVQQKVYQELQDIFGDSDRPLTWEDLPKLKYMEMVIKESLRLYPPVPVVTREAHEAVKLPSGPTLGPGMAIIFHIWATHRNPAYWGEDAELFRPERFSEPLRHPAQFIPFSYSIRNCAGSNYAMMSMKTNLASLLRRYRVLPPNDLDAGDMTMPLRVKFDIMMRDVDNFKLRLVHRENIYKSIF